MILDDVCLKDFKVRKKINKLNQWFSLLPCMKVSFDPLFDDDDDLGLLKFNGVDVVSVLVDVSSSLDNLLYHLNLRKKIL